MSMRQDAFIYGGAGRGMDIYQEDIALRRCHQFTTVLIIPPKKGIPNLYKSAKPSFAQIGFLVIFIGFTGFFFGIFL